MIYYFKKVVRRMNKETIGIRIKEKRKSKNITQTQLANILDKSLSSIQKYESGDVEIPHSIVEKIAETLDTTVTYLLGYDKLQKQLDELRLFKEELKLLGCNLEEINCIKEDNPEVISCKLNDTERYCANCDIKETCYLITYNNATVKVPIHDFENLREHFKSYMRFMLMELINKYQ